MGTPPEANGSARPHVSNQSRADGKDQPEWTSFRAKARRTPGIAACAPTRRLSFGAGVHIDCRVPRMKGPVQDAQEIGSAPLPVGVSTGILGKVVGHRTLDQFLHGLVFGITLHFLQCPAFSDWPRRLVPAVHFEFRIAGSRHWGVAFGRDLDQVLRNTAQTDERVGGYWISGDADFSICDHRSFRDRGQEKAEQPRRQSSAHPRRMRLAGQENKLLAAVPWPFQSEAHLSRIAEQE